MMNKIKLHWLSEMKTKRPVTFGLPWEKGKLYSNEHTELVGESGLLVSTSWPTAYWPDGSVKWTAHAAVIDGRDKTFCVTKTKNKINIDKLKVLDEKDYIYVENKYIRCKVNKFGKKVIAELNRVNKDLRGMVGKIFCNIRTREKIENLNKFYDEVCYGEIEKAEIEQLSSNRICIKVSGGFKQKNNLIPFYYTLRIYLYMDSDEVKFTFSITSNVDDDRELSGLALEMLLPMGDKVYNRHVAFSGDDGIYLEASQGLLSNHASRLERHGRKQKWYEQQLFPKYIDMKPYDGESKWLSENIHKAAVWNNFKLSQVSSSSWNLQKKTNDESCYVKVVSGKKSYGMMYVGSPLLETAFSIREFWQKNPTALEVSDISTDLATVRLWLWSDDASPKKFTFYDNRAHSPDLTYEGSTFMGSDSVGISNTCEMTVKVFERFPTRQNLWDFAQDAQKQALLVAEPAYYYDTKACGKWGKVYKDNGLVKNLEILVSEIEDFYIKQMEQRDWYGFWDYGDVMHSYDYYRHMWKYDFGGCAWQNTELVPNIWLWNSFLRSGREEIFYLARAMTRHTSEVDCYHIGELTGLGSRHNVVHWGCSCKEPRIMMTFLHRIFYFLCADERVGEIMELASDSDIAATRNMPLLPPSYGTGTSPARIRTGPDWTAFASNWLVHEERFRDSKYITKLKQGIYDICSDEIGLLAGTFFNYYADNGKMEYIGDANYSYHMIMIFGGAEVFYELMQYFPENSRLPQMLAEFGRAYIMTEEELAIWTKGRIKDKSNFGGNIYGIKMMIWAANYYNDREIGEIAWNNLRKYSLEFADESMMNLSIKKVDNLYSSVEVEECNKLSTNLAAQFSLALFQAVDLILDYQPDYFNTSKI